ncbi:MAG: hypothetical protein ACOCWC_04730 [Bacteroidota bacterium]
MEDKNDIISADNKNDAPSKGKKSKIAKFFTRPTTIIIILLLIGWGITYFYMDYMSSRSINTLEKTANKMLFEKDNMWLKNTIKPLTWAIRSEMLRENLENINEYQNEFVKLSGFSNLMLIDNNGIIWLSTDKKYEEEKFTEHYPGDFLNNNSIYLQSDAGTRQINVSAPIMGIDSQLGTVFVIYSAPEKEYFDVQSFLKE